MCRRHAFTLIELLVVIAIIALLMGILMPALMKAKDHGKRIVCNNHLRTLALANVLYADEADGWYVPIMDRTQGDDRYWPANRLFRELVGYKPKNIDVEETWNAPREYLCPSDIISKKQIHDAQYDNWISYGYNLTDWYFSDWFGIGSSPRATTGGSGGGAPTTRTVGTFSARTPSRRTRRSAATARRCIVTAKESTSPSTTGTRRT
ncbi:MAG: type II secretion system protein [Sedimentisphaerales bacterium]